MFEAETERIPNRTGLLITWLPKVTVGLVFVAVGTSKFRDPMWVRLFAQIGFGQWFRYLTGVMQICGAALVLIPRLSLAGIALLACTMAGAVVAWLTVLHAPFNALIPGVLLGALIAIGAGEYARSRG